MKRRILGRSDVNYYHVMSRVVGREFIFGDAEKDFFLKTMRRLEGFTGVRILSYCLMSNHFHLLIEVPKVEEMTDGELELKLKAFYSRATASGILQEIGRAREHAEQTGGDKWLNELREKYVCRMGSLSVFSKELKERFSKWYNRSNNRRGTLWEERFKSVLVEGSENALLTMAAYIELNPVRAGIVEDPKDYRYCSYAEAVAGGKLARAGIAELLSLHGQSRDWRTVTKQYRCLLFSAGEATEERKGFDPERVRQVLEENGELAVGELLRCHVRYFNDGVALGSQRFIEEVFAQNRRLFGEKRRDGARPMKGGEWNGLCSLRNLSSALAVPG